MNIDLEGDFSYIIRCDLSIPSEIHDYLIDYPPLAFKTTYTFDDLSPYQRKLSSQLDSSRKIFEELSLNFLPKKDYVIHIALLQFVLKLGVQLDRKIEMLKYRQSDFLKTFIDDCVNKRRFSKSEAEKTVLKLYANSLYGRFLMRKQDWTDTVILKNSE